MSHPLLRESVDRVKKKKIKNEGRPPQTIHEQPQHQVTAHCGLKKYVIQPKKISSLISVLLDHLEIGSCELSVEFVGPRRIRSLNRDFRQKDRSTDVLSFPQNHWRRPILVSDTPRPTHQMGKLKEVPFISGPLVLGDLVISLEDAEKNAKKIGQGLDREVCFLMVHGILHLCGHDHMIPKEERLMLQQQERAMEIIKNSIQWKGVVRKLPSRSSMGKSFVSSKTNFRKRS